MKSCNKKTIILKESYNINHLMYSTRLHNKSAKRQQHLLFLDLKVPYLRRCILAKMFTYYVVIN